MERFYCIVEKGSIEIATSVWWNYLYIDCEALLEEEECFWLFLGWKLAKNDTGGSLS